MKENHSWKRTDEVEIDLADLLNKLCLHWRQALIWVLISVILLGVYGGLKNRNKTVVQKNTDIVKAELTEEEEQAVENAIRLENELKKTEEYIENSIWMQIDPYKKPEIYLLYSIDGAKQKTLQKLAESYISFLLNGGAVEAVRKADRQMQERDSRFLIELIKAGQKVDLDTQFLLSEDKENRNGILLYIEVTDKNSDRASQLAENIQDAMKEYAANVKKICGVHSLTLLSVDKNIRVDWDLRAQQQSIRDLQTSNKTNLKTLIDTFNQEQMLVYEYRKGGNDKKSSKDIEEQSGRDVIYMVYILAGILLGIFLYCGTYTCRYLLSDVLKNAEEFRSYYRIPFYGSIFIKKNVSDTQNHGCEEEYTQLINRIRLVCKRQGISKLCLVAGVSLSEKEKWCAEQMAEQLRQWGIDTLVIDNVIKNINEWNKLVEIGTILMICKIGGTTHRMIDEEMEFYEENEIGVIGVTALEVR